MFKKLFASIVSLGLLCTSISDARIINTPTPQAITSCTRLDAGVVVSDKNCDNQAPVVSTVSASIIASRTSCTSPCTVIFAAYNTTDSLILNQEDAYTDLGYHFDFDDPTSPNHTISGLPSTSQVGGPIATHTFICDSGQCSYDVGVRAQNILGSYDDAFVTVTVNSATQQFSNLDTICVSSSSTYTGDVPCPAGATQVTDTPAAGSYSGKRVLFRKGETFSTPICIQYSESNVLIESFGNNADAKPVMTSDVQVGVDSGCDDVIVTTAQAQALPDHWADRITINGLRIHGGIMGMSFRNVNWNDIDSDWLSESTGGFLVLTSNGEYCVNNAGLDCSEIQYPSGLYVSNSTWLGSTTQAVAGTNTISAGVAFAGYNCPLINWLGILNTEFGSSTQHEMRLEGGQNISISHGKTPGRIGQSSPKHMLALRACGPADTLLGTAIAALSGRINAVEGDASVPRTKYGVIADQIAGDLASTNGSFKYQLAPSSANPGVNETVELFIVERDTFFHPATNESIDIAFNGRYLTARDNTYNTPNRQDCTDTGPAGNPVWLQSECNGTTPPVPLAPGTP